jgi:hypothetical protein
MHHDGGLELGMFLGGLLMALVPISITIGLGIWALKERQRARALAAPEPQRPEDVA